MRVRTAKDHKLMYVPLLSSLCTHNFASNTSKEQKFSYVLLYRVQWVHKAFAWHWSIRTRIQQISSLRGQHPAFEMSSIWKEVPKAVAAFFKWILQQFWEDIKARVSSLKLKIGQDSTDTALETNFWCTTRLCFSQHCNCFPLFMASLTFKQVQRWWGWLILRKGTLHSARCNCTPNVDWAWC